MDSSHYYNMFRECQKRNDYTPKFNSDIRVGICKRRYGRKSREGVENKVG